MTNLQLWVLVKLENKRLLIKHCSLHNFHIYIVRSITEVPETTSTAALFLELSVLPIKFEIEQRQLFFLKCMLDKDPDDPVHVVYKEQQNCNFEENWTKFISQVWPTDNLPLNDEDMKRITLSQ